MINQAPRQDRLTPGSGEGRVELLHRATELLLADREVFGGVKHCDHIGVSWWVAAGLKTGPLPPYRLGWRSRRAGCTFCVHFRYARLVHRTSTPRRQCRHLHHREPSIRCTRRCGQWVWSVSLHTLHFNRVRPLSLPWDCRCGMVSAGRRGCTHPDRSRDRQCTG